MLASIIICTHNRQPILAKCLTALQQQFNASTPCEVIVVANACSDQTVPMVTERIRLMGPQLRLIEETRPGLSIARNTGAQHALGQQLIYLDDDAVPLDGWLDAYLERFKTFPQVVAGGGPILPDWSNTPRPSYWCHQFEINRAGIELPPDQTEFTGESLPFGANMFFRADLLHDHGGFNPAYGMKANKVGLAEETDLFLRIRNSGKPIAYVHHAKVSHWVNPRDITRWGLVRRAYVAGKVGVQLFGVPRPPQGWSGWTRQAVSTLVKGRMTMEQLVYLSLEMGRLTEWSVRSRRTTTR